MEIIENSEKVLVAMSGGVDSAAAAVILINQGYRAEGLTFVLTDSMEADAKRAAAICENLNIGHRTLDLRDVFERKVRNLWAEDYFEGRTPNPCVYCNREIKFGAVFEYARAEGFDKVATGHYCELKKDADGVHLLCGDAAKDQSYFLCDINPKNLEMAIFPLAGKNKDEIRAMVEFIGDDFAKTKDSQDICFVPDGDYAAELKKSEVAKKYPKAFEEGVFEKDGEVLAHHSGAVNFTIGQRKGTGIAYPLPLYVLSTDMGSGKVFMGTEDALMKDTVRCGKLNILNNKSYEKAMESNSVYAKIRYSKKSYKVKNIAENGDGITVVFDEKVRAAAPGQWLVIYSDNECLGGAQIQIDKLT